MIKNIKKRNGDIVAYESKKIQNAIEKALKATHESRGNNFQAAAIEVTSLAEAILEKQFANNTPTVEEIQDVVEKSLMLCGFHATARAYILYRKQHEKVRETTKTMIDASKLMSGFLGEVKDWRTKESSTVTTTLGGLILYLSGSVTANFWLNEIYDEDVRNAHKSALIHLHDLSMLSGYCAGWSLKQLIQTGIKGVEGRIASAPAKHLHTLSNQMVNFLGIMQNEWAGAQAFSSFDTLLAPYVKADNLSYKEVKQCIQSFVYGVNTPSRWGCVDTDTEVLSATGFKKYNELKEGDMIYSWKDGTLVLNPVRKVIQKPFSGKLHSYQGRHYNQTVTPNHRMLVKKFNKDEYEIKLSEEVFANATPYALPVKFASSNIAGANLTNDEIMLAAMVYTDGSIDMRKDSVHKVTIHKSPNRVGNDEIVAICDRLGLKYSVSEKNGQYGPVNIYAFYGDSARFIKKLVGSKKSIHPQLMDMNAEQANLFLNTWASFDGDEEKKKLQFDNEEIRDQLQQIAILAGHASYICKRNKTNYVKIRQVSDIYPTSRTEIEYDGIVWCPNVEAGTAVFRKDGAVYISGQTQAPFSNITLDWVVPKDMELLPAIVGGKMMPFTYGECKPEMDMVNKAFLEIMIEGDADGRGFQYPIPTYSITKEFDWSETENNKLLFEMAAKYGTPYFSNYINSDMDPSDVRSMCCRLRLELNELRKKGGGYFGSGDSTGSIGVVTLNLPRLAYLAADEQDFYAQLEKTMDIAARSLDTKRKVITSLMEQGLYPYTKAYLGSFDNHFSTIGLVGMNEAAMNAKWLRTNLTTDAGQEFAKKTLDFMREKLKDYQTQYGALFNLEATPAESTSFRFAKHDVEQYPEIITAAEEGQTPFYTNSSHLPVGHTDDIFDALDLQDDLQTRYTSGTVFHGFLGERLPDWRAAANLVKKVAENYRLPYFTLSPVYSICPEHGYLAGEHETCPHCGQEAEVYSRITGYYRPVKNWNDGKVQEYKQRKAYAQEKTTAERMMNNHSEAVVQTVESAPVQTAPAGETILVTTATCPNCTQAKSLLDAAGIRYKTVLANENRELVRKFGVSTAPTLIKNGKVLAGLEQIIAHIS